MAAPPTILARPHPFPLPPPGADGSAPPIALLVVDTQNDFLHPAALSAFPTLATDPRRILGPLAGLMKHAFERNWLVVTTKESHLPSLEDATGSKKLRYENAGYPIGMAHAAPAPEGAKYLIRGNWGTQLIPELQLVVDDINSATNNGHAVLDMSVPDSLAALPTVRALELGLSSRGKAAEKLGAAFDDVASAIESHVSKNGGLRPALNLYKPGQSIFAYTFLHELLTRLGITHVLVTGVTSECCVLATYRTAGDLGYYALLVEDCCAAFTDAEQAATVEVVCGESGAVGWVGTSADVIKST
ncbi:Isochorismatase-like protein [Hyaloraphidium curvatum]|nr:Isochorismatase-like protein [Hyaloraphidium curvatum]